MRDHDDRPAKPESTMDPTAALPADLLNPIDSSAGSAAQSEDWGLDGLPPGSAVLVVKRGPKAGSRFRLHKPVTTAGRHPDSDIFVDDITASRRHAEFRAENGQYRVVDSSSLNGTYVNHQAVDSVVLADGDEVQIGKSCLVFVTKPATDGTAVESGRRPDA